MWTDAFSKLSGITINKAWLTYNDIFLHPQLYNAVLHHTDEPWKF
jgi:hypothetical protein